MDGFDRHTLGAEAGADTSPPRRSSTRITSWPKPSPSICSWDARQSSARTISRKREAICAELGLGDLLDRMPAGLLQMVGETGWQLSHGERSRLYIARALLQDAELVVLDESFAALDPENLQARRRVRGQARAISAGDRAPLSLLESLARYSVVMSRWNEYAYAFPSGVMTTFVDLHAHRIGRLQFFPQLLAAAGHIQPVDLQRRRSFVLSQEQIRPSALQRITDSPVPVADRLRLLPPAMGNRFNLPPTTAVTYFLSGETRVAGIPSGVMGVGFPPLISCTKVRMGRPGWLPVNSSCCPSGNHSTRS